MLYFIILVVSILIEVLGLLADHHIPFGICQTISSAKANIGCWVLRATSCPTDLIAVQLLSNCLRPYILVVEPSPSFRNRSSAADCPLLHLCCFLTFHAYPFGLRCREQSFRTSQQFTQFALRSCLLRDP